MIPVLTLDPLLSGDVGWTQIGIVILKVVLAFVILLVILIMRPNGLAGDWQLAWPTKKAKREA